MEAAQVSVAVIVPTRRANNAKPFMESLRATAPSVSAWAVVYAEHRDVEQAWGSAGAMALIGTANTYASKLNYGYRMVGADWLLLVGDDVKFHPGWLEAALAKADETGAQVVGVNGLGTERERAGQFATHQLVRRAYVDEVGASWDGPGVVAHEGYGHMFVDDEIVTAAMRRGVWAMAVDSIVEHVHHYFGKAPVDDTYRLGESSFAADRALFRTRSAANR
jgi:hypothetical protein